MKKPVQVYISSVLKACRSPVNVNGSGKTTTTTTTSCLLTGPPQLTRMAAAELAKVTPPSVYGGNPCLDLFFHVKPLTPPPIDLDLTAPKRVPYSHNYLKHLLPLAWSRNPLTTLKLICNLLDSEGTGKHDREGFFTAAYWLYQNHPTTLASNVIPIAASFGSFPDILELLYRTLEGEDVRTRNQQINTNESDSDRANSQDNSNSNESYLVPAPDPLELDISKGIEGRAYSRKRRDKIFSMANKAIERYRIDHNYRFLHDGISELYAQSLKSDIQNFNNYHMINNGDDGDGPDGVNEIDNGFEITTAAKWCPSVDSIYDLTTLLCESIAKKVFPRESAEEADYACRVRDRLRKEVLEPLRKALESKNTDESAASNRWGSNPVLKPEPCSAKAYLEKVKAGGASEIKAGALLPNEIVGYVNDAEVGEAAELQWKTMEEMYLKQGKLKNCLAVYDTNDILKMMAEPSWDTAVALSVLTSQLSEEPWKGKVIAYRRFIKPLMHSIQGDDLKSMCRFVRSMQCGKKDGWVNLDKVYDLILDVAVRGNLKPEQMIRKLFVFTPYHDFYDSESPYGAFFWKNSDLYEKIPKKFKENGYGDVVPEVVFWNMNNLTAESLKSKGKGVFMGGFSNDLVKSFLDNDGDIGPDHVMEAAVAGEKYQSLVVVD